MNCEEILSLQQLGGIRSILRTCLEILGLTISPLSDGCYYSPSLYDDLSKALFGDTRIRISKS